MQNTRPPTRSHQQVSLEPRVRRSFHARSNATCRTYCVAAALAVVACMPAPVVCVADGDVAATEAGPPKPMPRIAECGVASVLCALEELGIPVSQPELEEQFRIVHGGDDLSSLSVEALVEVLTHYGVKASAVKFEPANVDKVPLPAILYISPQFRSRVLGTGHFAVLTDVNDEYGRIVDLTMVSEGREDGEVLVNKGLLRIVWKGEAILLSTPLTGLSRIFASRTLVCSAFVLLTVTLYASVGARRQFAKRVKNE